MYTKAQQLRQDAYWRYRTEWGNYMSDRNKTKKLLREEMSDILHLGEFTKDDLIEIKDLARELGFKDFDLNWNRRI